MPLPLPTLANHPHADGNEFAADGDRDCFALNLSDALL